MRESLKIRVLPADPLALERVHLRTGHNMSRPPCPRPLMPYRLAPLLLLLAVASGCASYEYNVIEPPELAGHVGGKSWVALRRAGDLEYRLRAADDRLVMRVYNRGDRAIKLLGPDSAIVDPRGETHPMPSATIPPGSYVQRVFPPPPPRVRRYGPSFGFGVGVMGAHRGRRHYVHRHRYPFHSAGFHDLEPRYYTVYDPNDPTYFAWPGGTSVRFIFAFRREGEEVVRQEFLIRRVKVN